MSNLALRVENLGKRFRIGSGLPYRRASEVLTNLGRIAVRAPGRLLGRHGSGRDGDRPDAFWALRDVSFDVKVGEAVGVIGRNGAGKSTLLRVLSRITEPTLGRFGVRGRVGSLLEVGTGFHPELTGRENVFLSGTILGMTRAEIKRHFDAIVAFAEVETFLDTPVKRYSSGMRVRLGFAVAAHLRPEVLIVDEVLAVGDASFQQKCLGKMSDVAAGGRTVLFVSHDMAAIERLCHRAVLLADGRVEFIGDAGAAVRAYSAAVRGLIATEVEFPVDASKALQVLRIRVLGENGVLLDLPADLNQPITFEITYDVRRPVPADTHAVLKASRNGQVVLFVDSLDSHTPLDLSLGRHVIRVGLPTATLNVGEYVLSTSFGGLGTPLDCIRDALAIELTDHLTGRRGLAPRPGVLGLKPNWTRTSS